MVFWLGLNPNIEYIPGLDQCQKGYLCRKSTDFNDAVTGTNTCQESLSEGDKYSSFASTQLDISSDFTIYASPLFDPALNPCGKNHVCSTKGTGNAICVEIGSIDNGIATSNPLAFN